MPKKILYAFAFVFLFLSSLHSQSRTETYAWIITPTDTCATCGKIVRLYENDSTFMEIGMFYNSDTAWYKIRNGKWFMKSHEKDSFALFFDTAFVNDTTPASWSYPITYSVDNWSDSLGHCNEIRPYYWKKENSCYNGYPIYRVYYWDVRFDPPQEMSVMREDGTIKKRVCAFARYIHPPVYYFFTYQLGIFGIYGGDLPLTRPGIDYVFPEDPLEHVFAEEVFYKSALFQSKPFSLVDTIYVYEEGRSLATCFCKGGKFIYSKDSVNKGWQSVNIKDTNMLLGKRCIVQKTDSGVLWYNTSLLVSVHDQWGEKKMKFSDGYSRKKARYYFTKKRKCITLWISWKTGPDPNSPKESAFLTYKRDLKNKRCVLISYGSRN